MMTRNWGSAHYWLTFVILRSSTPSPSINPATKSRAGRTINLIKRQSKRLQKRLHQHLCKSSKQELSSPSWSNSSVKIGTQHKPPLRKPQTLSTALSSKSWRRSNQSPGKQITLKPTLSIKANSYAPPSSIKKSPRRKTRQCKALTPPNGHKQRKKSLTHYMKTTPGR